MANLPPPAVPPAPAPPAPLHGPSAARQAAALAAAAAAAVLGALILGEYDLSGAIPFVAGVLFGLAVAELTLTIAHRGTPVLTAGAALLSGGGLGWAAWISSGRGVAPVPGPAYAGIALGAVVAGAWVWSSTGRGQAASTADATTDPKA